MRRIIFLCHGNICRSPAAKWIAVDYVKKHGLSDEYEIESRACSSEEIGNDIYPPMKAALRRAGIPFGSHSAERLTERDYAKVDAIYYMDESNLRHLSYWFADTKRIFKPLCKGMPFREIEDPWYTGNFDLVVEEIRACVDKIFEDFEKEND